MLEGSVRRAGNNLRITAQLIDASTDAHLWAEKYSGTLDNVFDLQEQLSRRIVGALRLTLTPAEMQGLGERPMNDAAAYECYLRATYGADFWTPEGLARAETHLTHGLEIIGEHPAILAGLAFVSVQYVNVGLAAEDLLARALVYSDRALALDPRCSQAHAALGSIAALEGNAPKAVRHYEQAVAGAPGDVTSIAWLCWLYMCCGRTASASPLVERLLLLDPVNPLVHLVRGAEPYFEGRFAQAADLGMVFYRMAPGQSMFVFWYALLLAYADRRAEAADVLAALPGDAGDDVFARLGLMLRCTVSGDHHGFERLVTPRFEAVARRDAQDSWHVAALLSRLGQGQRALGWLENAVNRGFAHVQFIDETDPFLESIQTQSAVPPPRGAGAAGPGLNRGVAGWFSAGSDDEDAMTLTPGTRLGPYEVVALLGEGGMGEVYRARDTQLKRDVALKVLPAAVASDPDRLARFQREAELLAALNHPHVAQVYGVVDDAGVRAIVMELVEGQTLAERIEKAQGSSASALGYGGTRGQRARASDR